ncbi:hypothetical protein OM076_27365 [Solirubrobacter ginsenosidimutans]|uniref:MBL fold metallo-hydrolase n=1 Tax=Solirubrobacter ginsenosidimutans TaxID=490573 RepID=A0A9X3MWZ6_9ACTN|nr:hypothetical protein [Solirubrobacter ginsenosidimutans]MDA0164022.1 hypothetical protein [Solirubrobacter ginsenosidimutans]
MRQLADGLWFWTARHPEWHPRSEFGAQVGCYLAHEGGRTILIDPLLGDADLDPLIDGDVVVAITLPYHVRDAAVAVERWGGVVSGHPDIAGRLPDGTPFDPDAGLAWHPLKRGKERPLELPGLRALAFGDRIVGVDGGLRYWSMNPITPARIDFFRRRTSKELAHLLEIDFDRALVTHGEPVMKDARAALENALAADPWYHRPS